MISNSLPRNHYRNMMSDYPISRHMLLQLKSLFSLDIRPTLNTDCGKRKPRTLWQVSQLRVTAKEWLAQFLEQHLIINSDLLQLCNYKVPKSWLNQVERTGKRVLRLISEKKSLYLGNRHVSVSGRILVSSVDTCGISIGLRRGTTQNVLATVRKAGIQSISFKGAANISIRVTGEEKYDTTVGSRRILRSMFETLDAESKDLDLSFYRKEWVRLPEFFVSI